MKFKSCPDCSEQQIEDFFSNEKTANRPFILHKTTPTNGTILVIHGFSDSPYYMKDLAKLFYDSNLNVVAIRLSGHGEVPESLQNTDGLQWIQDATEGLRIARILSPNGPIYGAGFSTGAALLLTKQVLKDLDGVLLFSPAISLTLIGKMAAKTIQNMKKLKTIINYGWLNRFTKFLKSKSVVTDNCGNCKGNVRYSWFSLKSVVDVQSVIDERDESLLKEKDIPLFMAVSANDKTISFYNALKFYLKNSNPGQAVVFTQNQNPFVNFLAKYFDRNVEVIVGSEELSHSDIPIKQTGFARSDELNPHFGSLESSINDFLSRHLNCNKLLQ